MSRHMPVPTKKTDKMINIFTYGSLMFDRVWSSVVGGKYTRIDGRLYGFVRKKVRGETYPAVLPGAPKDHVDGKLYIDVAEADMDRLDRFEGKYYQRQLEECKCIDDRRITAYVYVLKDGYLDLLEDSEWDPDWFSMDGIHTFLSRYKGFR